MSLTTTGVPNPIASTSGSPKPSSREAVTSAVARQEHLAVGLVGGAVVEHEPAPGARAR